MGNQHHATWLHSTPHVWNYGTAFLDQRSTDPVTPGIDSGVGISALYTVVAMVKEAMDTTKKVEH